MSEEQIKILCKWIVENGGREFSCGEKEILKQAIDKARNMEELFNVAMASLVFGKDL